MTSTVLSFQYDYNQTNYHLNLLDTPGHQDFSEDTYRTLAAADNCVMLIGESLLLSIPFQDAECLSDLNIASSPLVLVSDLTFS